jgi:hypothetical protein
LHSIQINKPRAQSDVRKFAMTTHLSIGNSSKSGVGSSFNDKTTIKEGFNEEQIIAEETEVPFRLEKFKDENIKSARLNLVIHKCLPGASLQEQAFFLLRSINIAITVLGLEDVMSTIFIAYPEIESIDAYISAWTLKAGEQRIIAVEFLDSCSASLSETSGRLTEADNELKEAKSILAIMKDVVIDSTSSLGTDEHHRNVSECKEKIKDMQKNKDSLEDRVLGLRQRVMSAAEVVHSFNEKAKSGATKQYAYVRMVLSRSKIQEGALIKHINDLCETAKDMMPYMSKHYSDPLVSLNPFDPMEMGLARYATKNLTDAFEDKDEISAVMVVLQAIKENITKKSIPQRIRTVEDFMERLRRQHVTKVSLRTMSAIVLLINGTDQQRSDFFDRENLLKRIERQSGAIKGGSVIEGEMDGGLYERTKDFFEEQEQKEQQSLLFSKPRIPHTLQNQTDLLEKQRQEKENKILATQVVGHSPEDLNVCYHWAKWHKCDKGSRCKYRQGHLLAIGAAAIDEFGVNLCIRFQNGAQCIALGPGGNGNCILSHLPVYKGPLVLPPV